MKQQLSKREKLLIILMAVIVVVFVGYRFVVSPVLAYYNNQITQRDNLQLQKDDKTAILNIGASLEENFGALQDTYNNVLSAYPYLLVNDDIDRLVTTLCSNCNLEPFRLSISDIKTPAGDTVADITTDQNIFYVITANMNLSGDYDALKSLLNTLSNNPYIVLRQFSFSNAYAAGSTNLTASFDVEMLNPGYYLFQQ